ncbi:FGGY family carbohydrate kinase [Lichenihabitans sp. Uapishka_5]|uniref:FGGY family carbohydrate kinase n=1 Tax=Lichenihabitans sp. Uapishka_5 TaxID=3037302 RepID=UPI0029E7E0AD|nr:FGGY family carbohydrate kinase [Lichenihabitans sp. Uapishka_5]MDX7951375.1 FGGY family carbohydrate kinase [Lichenihabitans sp. Uapishka_5]
MRVAAIDQGTTSTRCFILQDGDVAEAAGTRRHAQFHPQPGWVEHDPEELLRNVEALLRGAGPFDAIAIANQGESCLAWDARTGAPLSPVIVWQDARTTAELGRLDAVAAERSKAVSGLPLDPYFSASKLAWLVREVPAVVEALANGRLRLGTTDTFFLNRLGGVFRTDLATASRTGLLDLDGRCWSAEMCGLHGVPIACLPEITEVDAGFGRWNGIPIRASIVDQQAALYGHRCRAPGDCKITFGTGAFLLSVTGASAPREGGLLPTVAWHRRGETPVLAVEGGVYDAGAAVEWARGIGLFSAMEELAAFEGPSALSRGIAFVPALSGLAAPYWDRQAAPLFIGMNHATSRRDLARAVLEGIAMLTVCLIEAAAGQGFLGPAISIDGGLSQSGYFAQFLACASGRTITVPAMHELTALGLAELCGVDTTRAAGAAKRFAPAGGVSDADHRRFAEAVSRSRGWRA